MSIGCPRPTLRPTGPEELDLVRALAWRRWPLRLPRQPIVCPVMNQDYATKIARDWNVPASARATLPGSRSAMPSSTATACSDSEASRSTAQQLSAVDGVGGEAQSRGCPGHDL